MLGPVVYAKALARAALLPSATPPVTAVCRDAPALPVGLAGVLSASAEHIVGGVARGREHTLSHAVGLVPLCRRARKAGERSGMCEPALVVCRSRNVGVQSGFCFFRLAGIMMPREYRPPTPG
jgi:hypothetical protein